MGCFALLPGWKLPTLPFVSFFPILLSPRLTLCEVTTPYNRRPSVNLALLIARYIRQFTRTDPKEAIQYVYCVCLTADQGEGVGKEQVETAWDLCRKVIVSAETSGGWEELVGGFRQDGIKFVSLEIVFTMKSFHASLRMENWSEVCPS